MFDDVAAQVRPDQRRALARAGPAVAAGRRAAPSTRAPASGCWTWPPVPAPRRCRSPRPARTSCPATSRLGMLRGGQAAAPRTAAHRGRRDPAAVRATASFDAVTISFGLRNVQDTDAALREMLPGHQARRPGRDLRVQPPHLGAVPHRLHRVPDAGAAAGRASRVRSSPDAYVYLAESIRAWPDQPALAAPAAARPAGRRSAWRNLTGGIVALHRGVRGRRRPAVPCGLAGPRGAPPVPRERGPHRLHMPVRPADPESLRETRL